MGTSTTLSSTTAGCSWSSGNPSVATITPGGVVTGVGAGTAVITYTSTSGCIRIAVVTVNPTLPANTGNPVVCVGTTTPLYNATTGGIWSSGNALRATVNTTTGVVNGVSVGTVNITYRVGTCYSITLVTVNSNATAITGTTSLCVGTTTALSYAVSGGTWSSSNTAKATIDMSTGVVTGISTGTSVITYTIASGCFKTTIVTVNSLTTPISCPATVCQGSSVTVTNATSGGTWSSSNNAVATIGSASGIITGMVAGTSVITYRMPSGCYTTAIITVNAAPAAISGKPFVCAGSVTVLANISDGGTWSSSNTTVATVSASGVVTGLNAGTAVIYYSFSTGCAASVVVTVGAMPAVITGSTTVCTGSSCTLSSATAGGTWSSSNTSVATINTTSGVVTAISSGTTVITYVMSSGCMRTTTVTVNPVTVVAPIVGATVLCSGTSVAFTTATTGGAWSSSNTAVAVVNTSGLVTGTGVGTAVISYAVTGSCGTAYATATVTVNGIPSAGVISGSSTVCVGSVIPLFETVSGGIWTSGNPTIASTCPCNSGQVTGVAPGVAILSYTVTNDCGTSYATYPVTVNAVPSITPGLVTPVIAGTTTASLPFTTTGTPVTYSIVWGSTASAAGFVNVTGAAISTAPLSVAIPATATEATYTGVITVNNGSCTSVAQTISITVNQSVNIYTYAGTGINGYTGNGNAATLARVSHPYNIATDCDGNTFIADFENAVVRKVSPTGVISTIAGTGVIGYSGDDGPATSATMSHPDGIALDAAGNVYFTDFNNHVVRRISTSGIITRVAGSLANGYDGDGGVATSAKLSYPSGLTIDGAGNFFIADNANNVIRKVTPSGIITTVAGNNIPGYTGDGGAATAARLNSPKNVHADGSGNLYISDFGNQVVRKVDAAGIITTFAGNGITGYSGDGGPATLAKLDHPYGITTDGSGNVYFSEYTNSIVRKVNLSGIISTIAGDHTIGYGGDGGPALLAQLNQPMGLSRDCAGRIFIADNANYAVRILGEYNRAPFFTAGNNQSIEVCYGSGAISMNTRLAVTDFDTTQPETWTVASAPAHGTLVASYGTTSTGSQLTPSGLSYTPAAGYAGTDVFVVRVSDGIATAFTTVNVTVSTTPVAGTISGTFSMCGTGVTHLVTTGTGGVWSSSNTAIAVVDSFGYVTGVGYGTSLISYTVTNACGTSVATNTVTFNNPPLAGSIIGAAKVCRGSSIPYISTISGGIWSSANTSVATVSSAGMVYGVDTGLTTITYTVTNACGTAYGLRDVTVEILPVASPITGPSALCVGASTTLYDATPHGAWYSSDESVATINIDNGTVTGVAAGTVVVSYRHNTSCGVVLVTKTLTINPASATIPAIAGYTTVCVGSTVTLSNAVTGGTWSTSGYPIRLTVDSMTGVVSGVSAGTAVVTYTVAHDCGSSYVTRVMTVNPLPVVSPITGTSSICTGTSIIASNATPGGVWSSSNTALATVNSAGVITGIAGGMPYISYSVTNSCGTVSATALVPVGTTPSIGAITGPSVVCVDAVIALSNTTAGGSWTTGNIAIASVNSAGIVTGVGEGTTTISYSVHNGCGFSYAIRTVSVNPLPVVATVTGPSMVNVGGVITLSCATTGGAWSSSNTALAAAGSTGDVTGMSHGTVTISYSVSNSCGTAVAAKVVNVVTMYASIYGSHVSAPGASDGCALLTVVGGVSPYTFSWSNGATTQNLTGLPVGTYSVLVTDAMGDTTSASVVISELSARGVAATEINEADGAMFGAHPNPFVSRSVIRFNLPVGKYATVDVFNAATGLKVATVFNDQINAGEEYTATIEGADIPAGTYIYRIATESKTWIGKVILVK